MTEVVAMTEDVSGFGENIGGQKRVILIVLDSLGIGRQPDAAAFGDEGSNTLAAIAASSELQVPNLQKLGIFSIDGVREDINSVRSGVPAELHVNLFAVPPETYVPEGCFARMEEKSNGKDTTIGHWEMAGIYSEKPLPVYPHGFPPEVLEPFEAQTGRKSICNLPYSGTDVIRDFGKQHMETGDLIVYTSADSVFQIAAHESVVPLPELYRCCEIARNILMGEHAVGRVIARPFVGEYPNFTRSSGRHDFSLLPPQKTLLDILLENRKDVIGVGKIHDIFAGRGLSRFMRTTGNADGIEKTKLVMQEPFDGLCFVNLVDFDMMYGHRNDVAGYAAAITAFDRELPALRALMAPDDLLMITADHGCDPSTASTDHSRECIPLLVFGQKIKQGVNLHTRHTFSDIAATILDYLDIPEEEAAKIAGTSFLSMLRQKLKNDIV